MNQDQARRWAEEVDLPEPDGTAEANMQPHPEGGCTYDEVPAWSETIVREAIAAALVKLTQQEPIVWGYRTKSGLFDCISNEEHARAPGDYDIPLYTHAAPSQQEESAETSKQRYDRLMDGENEPSAIERLRFFCSLAMSGQDWLDVEEFFDALTAPSQQEDRKPLSDFVRNLAKAYTDEARGLLDETYKFASQSPRGRDNINAVMQLLDDIDHALEPLKTLHNIKEQK